MGKLLDGELKHIDIKEFREKGYLQEVNRRFLHPLGLGLEVIQDIDGGEILGGIWDYRCDKEGLYYDINTPESIDSGRKQRFMDNKLFIDNEMEERCKIRKEILGFDIEPVE